MSVKWLVLWKFVVKLLWCFEFWGFFDKTIVWCLCFANDTIVLPNICVKTKYKMIDFLKFCCKIVLIFEILIFFFLGKTIVTIFWNILMLLCDIKKIVLPLKFCVKFYLALIFCVKTTVRRLCLWNLLSKWFYIWNEITWRKQGIDWSNQKHEWKRTRVTTKKR